VVEGLEEVDLDEGVDAGEVNDPAVGEEVFSEA